MTILIAVASFWLGGITWGLVLLGMDRLKRQNIILRSPTGWHEVKLLPAEDIAEATLRWHKALGVWEN